MGIPSYFKKIIDEFPNTIKTSLDFNVDNVFLDFNCCIHGCASELKSYNFNSNKEFEQELIKKVLQYIDIIFEFTNPSDLFYISIDGIPPRSKMVQQRNRRFMSSWSKNKLINKLKEINYNEKEINNIKNEWDSSAISPGTDFMNNLSNQIKEHFKSDKYKPGKSGNNKSFKTILSDSLEKGEGEFKIFKYIQDSNLSNKDFLHKNNVIYGLDADLIMLSLLRNNNICLLREPVHLKLKNNKKFIYLSINELKINLKNKINKIFSDDNTYDLNIDYYVFICFLLGNDFIPNLGFLNFKNDDIELLLYIYKNVHNELLNTNFPYKHILIIENYRKYNINYYFLTKFLKELSNVENKYTQKYSEEYYNKRPFFKSFNNDDVIEYNKHQIELYPMLNRKDNKINEGIDDWRIKYYYHLFNTINGKDIKDICKNFLESLEFTLDYYFNQKYHPTWYYRYNYSPTILDLYNYLLSLNVKYFKEDNQYDNYKIDIGFNNSYPDIDISIPLQLLMILPPSSIHLIKNEKHKKLMSDINEGVLHYYPINFNISTYLKNWLWLCKPKLPNIDINLLMSKI